MMFLLVIILLFCAVGLWGWFLLAGVLGLSATSDKATALQHIKQMMITHEITPAEVDTVFHAPVTNSAENTPKEKGKIVKTLFIYLGGIFVFAGISTYVGLFWSSMGSAMRIMVTLGIGYILFIVLISALYEKKFPKLILPLTIASAFFMTGGWYIFIQEMFPDGDNWRAATLFIFGVMTIHFAVLFGVYKRLSFAAFSLFFVYGFMYIGLDMLEIPTKYISIVLGSSLFLVSTAVEKSQQRLLAAPALLVAVYWLNAGLFDLIAASSSEDWASILTGLCIILTAYGLYRANRYPIIIGLGYLLGSMLFYSGLFAMVHDTDFELIFLAIAASMLYASVVLQSRMLLLTTVIAMLSYIGYFSATHFSDSLLGIVFLGIGSIALKLRKEI